MAITRQNSASPNPAEASTGTSLACNVPTAIKDGDILVAWQCYASGTRTLPGGWSNHFSSLGTAVKVYLDYRVVPVAASEPSSYTWTGLTSGRETIFMTAFRGVDNATPFDVTATTATTSTGSSVTIPAITTVTANCMIFAGFGGNASTSLTFTVPAGFTKIADTTGTGKGASCASDLFQVSPGSTGTKVYTWSQSALEMIGMMAALRPDVFKTGQVSDIVQVSAITRASRW